MMHVFNPIHQVTALVGRPTTLFGPVRQMAARGEGGEQSWLSVSNRILFFRIVFNYKHRTANSFIAETCYPANHKILNE